MYFVEDENFARKLQNEFNYMQTYKSQEAKENENPVDSLLEFIDPTPSIHDLFVKFNKKFFWSSLGMVEVTWSNRMTTCAGLCRFEGRRGCKISLSAPLLSLRPRKDLVETLLHEMIHAYLFVTNNYKDREDHGPEFHKHMYRINNEAGTKITVYHTFHDEVHYYQRHIWRCSGPCRDKKPYFGFVRRAMNRAPGPSDSWWNNHKAECNGTFIKLSEPEKKLPAKGKKTSAVDKAKKMKDIRGFFSPQNSPTKGNTNNNWSVSNIKTLADLSVNARMTGVKTNANTGTLVVTKKTNRESGAGGSKRPSEISRINNTFNLYAKEKSNMPKNSQVKDSFEKLTKKVEGISNNSGTKDLTKGSKKTNEKSKINFYAKVKSSSEKKDYDSREMGSMARDNKTLQAIQIKKEEDSSEDVRQVVRNVWANRFPQKPEEPEELSPKKLKIQCPVCEKGFSEEEIQSHVEECLETENEESEPASEEDGADEVKQCPVCSEQIRQRELSEHLENCLQCSFVNEGDAMEFDVECQSVPCPCCYKWFLESEMNGHIDDCLTLNALKEELLSP